MVPEAMDQHLAKALVGDLVAVEAELVVHSNSRSHEYQRLCSQESVLCHVAGSTLSCRSNPHPYHSRLGK